MNRCPKCGSRDTWDDETMWGCNTCDWMGSNIATSIVPERVVHHRVAGYNVTVPIIEIGEGYVNY